MTTTTPTKECQSCRSEFPANEVSDACVGFVVSGHVFSGTWPCCQTCHKREMLIRQAFECLGEARDLLTDAGCESESSQVRGMLMIVAGSLRKAHR